MHKQRLFPDTRGAVAAEFAMIVPVFVILFLGIIDTGMWMWAHNRAEKAAQAAVRHAAVIDFVPADLATTNFASAYNIPSGNPIPIGTIPPITCGGPLGSGCSAFGWNGTAYNAILERARRQFPTLTAANLRVRYEHVGLGYAGDPTGADVSPMVTVQIVDNDANNRLFNPIILDLIRPQGFTLTDVQASMTMEDGAGDISYSS